MMGMSIGQIAALSSQGMGGKRYASLAMTPMAFKNGKSRMVELRIN
jgi:hypothetical protein